MKFIKILSLLVIAMCISFFYSCQKNNGVSYKGTSYGSMKDSLGNCMPITIEGTYLVNAGLGNINYMDVHVIVNTVGKYNIYTDTLNGFSFSGNGTLGYKGDNRVRLYGHGKPTSSGTSIFTVTFGTSICTTDVTGQ